MPDFPNPKNKTFRVWEAGAVGSGSDETAAINRAITAANNAGRGAVVEFDPSAQYVAHGVSLDGMDSITLRSATNARQNAARIVSSSTGSTAVLSMVGSSACKVQGLRVENVSSSFTGKIVDAGSTGGSPATLCEIEDCYIRGVVQAGSSVVLLSLVNTYSMRVRGNRFYGGKYGIQGRSLITDFSNAQVIEGTNFFEQQDLAAIYNPGAMWSVNSNTFEPLRSGAPGAILCDTAIAGAASVGPNALSFKDNWMGDCTAGGIWVAYAGDVLICRDNYFDGGVTGTRTGIKLLTDCHGLAITGNRFNGFDTGFDYNSKTYYQAEVLGNYYSSVTTPVTGNGPNSSSLGGSIFLDPDVVIKRISSSTVNFNKALQFDDATNHQIVVQSASASTNYIFRAHAGTDSQDRIQIQVNGNITRGPGGSTVPAVKLWQGSGSPEGAIGADPGSLWQRNDGGAGTSLYVKESGTGTTGWKAIGRSTTIAAGTATLGGSGTASVSLPAITSTAVVMITSQQVPAGRLYENLSIRSAGTSFRIDSTAAGADSGITVAYVVIEP